MTTNRVLPFQKLWFIYFCYFTVPHSAVQKSVIFTFLVHHRFTIFRSSTNTTRPVFRFGRNRKSIAKRDGPAGGNGRGGETPCSTAAISQSVGRSIIIAIRSGGARARGGRRRFCRNQERLLPVRVTVERSPLFELRERTRRWPQLYNTRWTETNFERISNESLVVGERKKKWFTKMGRTTRRSKKRCR